MAPVSISHRIWATGATKFEIPAQVSGVAKPACRCAPSLFDDQLGALNSSAAMQNKHCWAASCEGWEMNSIALSQRASAQTNGGADVFRCWSQSWHRPVNWTSDRSK